MARTLYVVSLPIGNLADITNRALSTLRQVDLIVAEDTRNTSRILQHYQITTPFASSYFQGVENERIEQTLAIITREDKDLALVSDAGTPLISDPGYPLVRAAIERSVPVVPIPGATAVVTGLVASGLPADSFIFDGSVPRKASKRRKYFESIRNETRTVVLYESRHRLTDTLKQLIKILPDRKIVLARELTKLHEEFLRGTAQAVLRALHERDSIRGEFVLLIEGGIPEKLDLSQIDKLMGLLRKQGVSNKDILEIVNQVFGIRRNRAYKMLHNN